MTVIFSNLFSSSLFSFFFTIITGIIIFVSLVLINQRWVKTINYFFTFTLLPPITFVITKVISNNLALSLGMIGALSIVRFRNPVKSPLELVMYFSLITIGISMGVYYQWSLVLIFSIILVLFSTYFVTSVIKKIKGYDIFDFNFNTNDNMQKNILEIETKEDLDIISNSKYLVFFSKKENLNNYKLAFNDKEVLKKFLDQINNNAKIVNIEVQYNN